MSYFGTMFMKNEERSLKYTTNCLDAKKLDFRIFF